MGGGGGSIGVPSAARWKFKIQRFPEHSFVSGGIQLQSVNAAIFWERLKGTPSFVFVKMVWDDLWKLAVVWTALYLFHFLPEYMPVPGFAGTLIEHIHEAGSVAVAVLLVWFLIVDVWKSHGQN